MCNTLLKNLTSMRVSNLTEQKCEISPICYLDLAFMAESIFAFKYLFFLSLGENIRSRKLCKLNQGLGNLRTKGAQMRRAPHYTKEKLQKAVSNL